MFNPPKSIVQYPPWGYDNSSIPMIKIISPCSIPLKSPHDLVVYTTAMGPMGHQSVSLASD